MFGHKIGINAIPAPMVVDASVEAIIFKLTHTTALAGRMPTQNGLG